MNISDKVKRFPRDSGTFVKERAKKRFTGKSIYKVYNDSGPYQCYFCKKQFDWQPVIFNIAFPDNVACSQACKRNHLNPGRARKVKTMREIEIEEFVKDLEFRGRI